MASPNLTVALGHGAGQIQGARAEQQDSLGFGEVVLADGRRAMLAVIADGMGGHEGGALAAQVAVAAFARRCASGQDRSFSEALQAALQAANRAIAEETARDPRLRDMGCTMLAAAVDMANAHYISVGDSILWLVREGALTRLNADHSMAPLIDEALARGEITQGQAQFQRSGLRSALTGRTIPLIDARSVELRADDALLFATDGILTLSPEQMAGVITEVGEGDPRRVVDRLLEVVERHALIDQDNCSLLWLAANSAPPAAPLQRRRLVSPAGLTLLGGLALASIAASQLLDLGVLDPKALMPGLGEEKVHFDQPPFVAHDRGDAGTPTELRQGEKYAKDKRPSKIAPGSQGKAVAAPASAAPPAMPKAPAAKNAEPGTPADKQSSGTAPAQSPPRSGAATGTDATQAATPSSASQPRLVPDPAVIDQLVLPDKQGQ